MSERRTVLIPLIASTAERGHLLEVTFHHRIRLPSHVPLSAVATLRQAGIPLADECGMMAQRLLEGGRTLKGTDDVGAVIGHPASNIIGDKLWLGLILGMVLAGEERGPDFFIATGVLEDEKSEILRHPNLQDLIDRLAVICEHLERSSSSARPIPVLIPRHVATGDLSITVCRDIIDRIRGLGGMTHPVATVSEAHTILRDWMNPSRIMERESL